MQFGIFDHVERRKDVSLAQQYEERLQLIELYDRSGFTCYHVAEHHHSPLCMAPNQFVYLTAAAQRTKQLRLATAVTVLPLHNPIRVIEEICMLDQISGGRAEVGVGRGTDRAQEWRMWGGDESENDERFEESLAVLFEGLRSEFLSHKGRFFNYTDVWMALRPLQQPMPPLWLPGNPEHAGARGMNFIGGERTDIKGVRVLMDRYKEALATTPTPEYAGRAEPLYGAHKRILIGKSVAEATERARASWSTFRTNFLKPLPGGGFDPAEVPMPSNVDFDTALASGAVLPVTVEMMRDYMQEFAEESGANYFVGIFQWGDLTHEEAVRSVEAFVSEVMPAVS